MRKTRGRVMPVEECRAADTTLMDGVLAVNKPAGWSSHDVVAKLRPLFRGLKVGHAGTLDPAATGVLPILIGQATRVAEFLVEWDKEYETVLRLGQVTDTQDGTGTVLERRPVNGITVEQVRAEAARFVGRTMQVPPMYSAVKIGGVPLYRSARAGRTVEREPRAVTIHRLDVLGVEGTDIHLRVGCSKGTYIRTLCADLGQALGPGGTRPCWCGPGSARCIWGWPDRSNRSSRHGTRRRGRRCHCRWTRRSAYSRPELSMRRPRGGCGMGCRCPCGRSPGRRRQRSLAVRRNE